MSHTVIRRLFPSNKMIAGAALSVATVGCLIWGTPAYAATESAQQIAHQMIPDAAQYQAFSNIVSRESGWNPTATNPSSGAYGLVQALPASKMASAGPDYRTNEATQIKWGLNYMYSRYGSPVAAWQHEQIDGWY